MNLGGKQKKHKPYRIQALESDTYPNEKKLYNLLEQCHDDAKDFCITNIQEITKEDYENWIAE